MKDNCVGNYTTNDNSTLDRQWNVPFNNFDNVLFSMITFYEVATLENWPDLLFKAIDS
jgi:hypothetical protein